MLTWLICDLYPDNLSLKGNCFCLSCSIRFVKLVVTRKYKCMFSLSTPLPPPYFQTDLCVCECVLIVSFKLRTKACFILPAIWIWNKFWYHTVVCHSKSFAGVEHSSTVAKYSLRNFDVKIYVEVWTGLDPLCSLFAITIFICHENKLNKEGSTIGGHLTHRFVVKQKLLCKK